MHASTKKSKGLPIALIVAGAGLGAYLVIRKRQSAVGQQAAPKLDKVIDACNNSISTLEQRITRAAS